LLFGIGRILAAASAAALGTAFAEDRQDMAAIDVVGHVRADLFGQRLSISV
jgi:hypothetical protein